MLKAKSLGDLLRIRAANAEKIDRVNANLGGRRRWGHPFCAKNKQLSARRRKRKLLDAVQEMKVGPSRSIFRNRSQTALSCCDKESW